MATFKFRVTLRHINGYPVQIAEFALNDEAVALLAHNDDVQYAAPSVEVDLITEQDLGAICVVTAITRDELR